MHELSLFHDVNTYAISPSMSLFMYVVSIYADDNDWALHGTLLSDLSINCSYRPKTKHEYKTYLVKLDHVDSL